MAVDDEFATPAGTDLYVPAPGVLANDSDPDGTPLEVLLSETEIDGPGLVSLGADGELGVTPAVGFKGRITIDYVITDGDGGRGGARITVVVGDPGGTPVGVDDAYAATPDADLVVDAAAGVLANDTDADGDALEVVLEEGSVPDHGTVLLAEDGSFRYRHDPNLNPGFAGLDHFTYVATDDNNNHTELVTVVLTIGPTASTTTTAAPTDTTAPAPATAPTTAPATVAAAGLGIAAPTPPAGASLPRTGAADGELVATAAALLGAGALVTAAARRRSRFAS